MKEAETKGFEGFFIRDLPLAAGFTFLSPHLPY